MIKKSKKGTEFFMSKKKISLVGVANSLPQGHYSHLHDLILTKYLPQWPDMPSRTLAKKISRDTQTYTIEQCRSALRFCRGRDGVKNRKKMVDRSFQLEAADNLWKKYRDYTFWKNKRMAEEKT